MNTEEFVKKLEQAREELNYGHNGCVSRSADILDELLLIFRSQKHQVVEWKEGSKVDGT